MRLSEHKDLKAQIVALPEREKDKLLLRLIAKDKVLTEHLHFKLLENQVDLLTRVKELEGQIDEMIASLGGGASISPKLILQCMRNLTIKVNHHAKVTKDLNSEIELKLRILQLVPLTYTGSTYYSINNHYDKLALYFVKAVVSVLKKYEKLHEDLQFDLKDALNEVLRKAYSHKTAEAALDVELPKEV